MLFDIRTKRVDYAYNNVNDITAVQRDSALGDGFEYDLTQQITKFHENGTVNLGAGTVTNPAVDNNMLFDGCGNRTTLNSVNQTFNNMNQLTGTGIAYSSKGNLITYNGWTYSYDAQNRLTNATNGTTTASFYYDGKNRQIARSINNVKTFSVWDDWELIEEYGTGNVRTAAYLQGAHGPIKSLLNNIYFYQDELGSTSHIASSTGALLEYYKYDLYGKPHYFDPNNNNQELTASNFNVRDLFSGERWIPEISLYDLRNRFMSPDTGRFLQPDPIGFKGDSSNFYRYCGNDWANRTDPMGTLPAEGWQNSINNPLWLQLQRDAIHEDQQQQNQPGTKSSLSSTTTSDLHAGVMNYNGAAGLQNGTVSKAQQSNQSTTPTYSSMPTNGNVAVTYQQTFLIGRVPVVAVVQVATSTNGNTTTTTGRVGLGTGAAVGVVPVPASSIAVTGNVKTGKSSGLGVTATGAYTSTTKAGFGGAGSTTFSFGGNSTSAGGGYVTGSGGSIAFTYDWTISGGH